MKMDKLPKRVEGKRVGSGAGLCIYSDNRFGTCFIYNFANVVFFKGLEWALKRLTKDLGSP